MGSWVNWFLRASVVVAALFVVGIFAGVAHAGTITGVGGEVVFTEPAADASANTIEVISTGGLWVTDHLENYTVDPSSGCDTQGQPTNNVPAGWYSYCPGMTSFRALLGGGNDTFILCNFFPCDQAVMIPLAVQGQDGDDLISSGPLGDVLVGGGGSDTVNFSSSSAGVTANLATGKSSGHGTDTLSELENITGSSFNDTFLGSALPNTLTGGGGRDHLAGGASADTLNGGNENDVLDGGQHNDTMSGGAGGADIVTYRGRRDGVTVHLGVSGADDGSSFDGGAGARDNINESDVEIVIGGKANDSLWGDALAGPLTIIGGGGNDRLRGGAGPNILLGNAGNDNIAGGNDLDHFGGGLGNDLINAVDNGPDDVDCGDGVDSASSDAADTREGCEPSTTITAKPSKKTSRRTATFRYSSTTPGSTFQCKLDAAAWRACPSAGKTYTGLARGTHTFRVRAKDSDGTVDPTPAAYSWRIT
jgi:RTX calcium-binding nonapeptide repeat (4 copies)